MTQVAVDANERPVTQPPAELDGRPGLGPRDVRPGREAHDLGWSYAPHRAERIRQLLAAGARAGVARRPRPAIHGDTRDLGAPGLVARLAADPSAAAARLRAWVAAGAHMDADADRRRPSTCAGGTPWSRRLAAHPALAAAARAARAGRPGDASTPWLDVPTAVGADALGRGSSRPAGSASTPRPRRARR